jgi:16S rRNA (cytosine967-C5)-methyltransferase
VGRLAVLQGRLLTAAAALVAPGGALTYSVCTLTRAETLEVVERFLARDPGGGGPGSGRPAAWALDDLGAAYPALRHPGNAAFVQTLPSRDDTTGFFIARLRRVA